MSVFATFICFVPHQRPKTAKNKCGAQNGGFDAFEGTQCLKFLRPLMLRGALDGVGMQHLAVLAVSILAPHWDFREVGVPQNKPIPLLVPLEPRTTSGNPSKEA